MGNVNAPYGAMKSRRTYSPLNIGAYRRMEPPPLKTEKVSEMLANVGTPPNVTRTFL